MQQNWPKDNFPSLPSTRLIALDILKTVAIGFMIISHLLLMYGTEEAILSSFSINLAFFAEGIGAPAFVFSLGFSIVLSKRKSFPQVFKRGLQLLALGYLLNILKFYPSIALFHVFPQALFEATGRSFDSAGLWSFIFLGDFLHFAAIAYVLCAILYKQLDNLTYLPLLFAFIVFFTAPFLYPVGGLNYLTSFFYGKSFTAYFPLMPWIGFAFLGQALGTWFKNYGISRSIIWRITLIGSLSLALGIGLLYLDFPYFNGSGYYHRGFGRLLFYVGQLCVFFLLYLFIAKISPGWLNAVWKYCSHHITRIYFIQWVLIFLGWYFIPYGSQTWSQIGVLWFLFIGLTLSLAKVWEQLVLYMVGRIGKKGTINQS